MILLGNKISILKKCHKYLCSPNKSHQKTGAGIEELFFFLLVMYGKILFALTLILVLNDNSFDTLTVKQCEIMINDDVLLYSATNEDTACDQLLRYWVWLELLT